LTQVERKVIIVETTKKGKKDDAMADDDTTGPGAAAPAEITKPLLGVAVMLALLSTAFNRPPTARKPRIGIIEFYAALLVDLGPQFVKITTLPLFVIFWSISFLTHVTPPPDTKFY